MTLPGIVLTTMLIAGPTAIDQPQDTCTCMRTVTGGGDRGGESSCDGFNPATHATCSCEKVPVDGQVACEPKRPKAAGDDTVSHRHGTRGFGS